MNDNGRIWLLLVTYGLVVVVVLTFADHFDQFDDSFELSNPVNWYFTGTLPVSIETVDFAKDGQRVARLGKPVEQAPKSQKEHALLFRTMVIPDYQRPVLTFWYRMVTNDTIDYSYFGGYLGRPGDPKAVLRDGFRACEFNQEGKPYRPPAGFDLGWRTASYDLSGLFDLSGSQEQTVTLVFDNRNLHDAPGYESLGIWTYVDYVHFVDATPLPTPPGPLCAYLPLVMNTRCDPVPTQDAAEALHIVPTARPARPPTPEPSPTPEP